MSSQCTIPMVYNIDTIRIHQSVRVMVLSVSIPPF